ncbi:hypothetical protein J7355_13155 [Endozoicomonas sp. G2_2]|uniref:hypothetical protein n=1 Tax=Endozoicomonas sp. G2_2 TaxID=2821092 RepID=UPI001AD9DEC1|nr:hypothetical protein [Endozoicomonas sp. G2_2]MBO9471042.1 hypothetical protein [Endozoicomonas sp. G2_2]
MRVIDIEWDGPHVIGYDRESDAYTVPKDVPPDVAEGASLYCIHGRHPVYGPNVLLYIGQTRKSDSGRGVLKRIAEHIGGRFWYHVGLSVYFGVPWDSRSDMRVGGKTTIAVIESLLIAAHKPALNRDFIDCPKTAAKDMHLFNVGFSGTLLPECSGLGFDI